MQTGVKKKGTVLCPPLVLAIALLTTMLLLFGGRVLRLPATALTTDVHAAAANASSEPNMPVSACASAPTDAHCTGQDPMAEQCYRDAQTLSFIRMQDAQGRLLAIVQRRYSPTCQSEWGRIIAWEREPVSIAISSTPAVISAGPLAFTAMEFVSDLSHVAAITGAISTNGIAPGEDGGAALSTTLPALPAR
jgi:hypothetical protein